MCGICGLVTRDPSGAVAQDVLARMTGTLVHRGPDDSGSWTSPGVALGHTRLSIIDVAGGHQPLFNEDRTVCVVFNGEIYNHADLRAELERKGHVFATRADTEAIVHLYEESGERCVERLRGMFAFALWDTRTRSLLLARDRAGKKPLYYAETPEGLIFGSELKALMAHPSVGRDVDPVALDEYLTYLYIPPARTILAGVSKLAPAHTLTWSDGQAKARRYWELSFEAKRTEPEDELAEELRGLLSEAVRIRLMSEVPLGAFLSGGIDSSVVVALMAQASKEPVKTFSIGFEEADYSELPHARTIAERYATEHHEFVVRPDAVDIMPELAWHLDEPFADSSAIPTYYVSRETRRHVTVALNGDGGDEVFAGYDRYLAAMLGDSYRRAPKVLRRLVQAATGALPESERRGLVGRAKRFVEAAELPFEDRYAQLMVTFDAARRGALYSDDLATSLGGADPLDHIRHGLRQGGATHPLDRLLACDTDTYLPGDLLVKVDRMTMAHSLEGRSPFLDHHVMEFAATLPADLKLRGRTSKYLLKKVAANLLPPDILGRKKQGFGVPIGRWFRGPLKGWLDEVLRSPAARGRGYFRSEVVDRLIADHTSGRADHSHRLWALAMLELWHLMLVDKTLSPPSCAKVTLP